MKYFLLFVYCLLSAVYCYSQLPDCDIWLLDIKDSAGKISFLNLQNITNRKGYDNQPTFSPDRKYILYSSQRDSTKQTDIYKYEITTKKTSQFTKTLTSEYSPTFMPDEKNISVVMVEKDSAQRLWKFPLTGGKPKLIVDVDSVGYHCWMQGQGSIALFVLPDPFTLQISSDSEPNPKFVADSIGRCMRMNGTALYFTRKTPDKKNRLCSFLLPGWDIKQYDLIMEGEDYVFFSNKIIYCIGSKVISGDFNNQKIEIADLSSLGITNITRIAISPDGKKMVVVSNK